MSTSVRQVAGELVVQTDEFYCKECVKEVLEDLPMAKLQVDGAFTRWSWDSMPDLNAIDRLERVLDEGPEACPGHGA